MSPDKPVPISADGLKKLEAELEELRTKKRQEVAERIHAAMQFGDYSENSELEQAKNDQAFLEGRIQTLEQMVKNAAIIDETEHHDIVEIGSHVTIEQDGGKDAVRHRGLSRGRSGRGPDQQRVADRQGPHRPQER